MEDAFSRAIDNYYRHERNKVLGYSRDILQALCADVYLPVCKTGLVLQPFINRAWIPVLPLVLASDFTSRMADFGLQPTLDEALDDLKVGLHDFKHMITME
jgi:hypothetical protein